MAVDAIGRQPGVWEVRTVGRVRPDVRFEADRVRLPVEPPAFSPDRAVEIVTGINLQAGLIGHELEDAAGARGCRPGRKSERAAIVETPGVIVTPAVCQLLIVVPDAGADRSGIA